MKQQDLQAWLDADALKRKLKSDLEDCVAQLSALEHLILPQFEQDGVSKMTVQGRTVYIRTQLWARGKGETPDEKKANGIAALRSAGYDEYVTETFNTNQVSAIFRAAEGADDPLPAKLVEGFEVTEKFSLQSRKG